MIVSRLLGGAAIGVLSVTAPGYAQTDEIVVTATKREQTLQEVPIAVSVVDDRSIEQSNVQDLFDLQTMVPSLRISQLQNSSQTNFIIRGFGNGANNPGIESSVGVFIAAAILDLPVLERVEILRGPQSTLFGKNVSAGAISITTKRPEFEWGGLAEASYGNFDEVIFRGSLTGPISDKLAIRLSGSTNNREGYYTNVIDGTDINERDRWAFRADLLFEPTDSVTFRIIGDYNKIDEVCCGAVQLLNS
jgi:iron complex outermembrane recepter protein